MAPRSHRLYNLRGQRLLAGSLMIEVTAIRTATMLITIDGVTILTDPWFSTRMWWVLPTWQMPGILLEDLRYD